MTFAARKFNIHTCLIAAIIDVESGGDPNAVSTEGAMGLMQVMPFHFGLFQNPFHPMTNILVGCKVLTRCYQRTHSLEAALAAYNGAFHYPNHILTDGYTYIASIFQAQKSYLYLSTSTMRP